MIRVGNAPCSWGTIEGLEARIPYAQMLDELVGAGFEGTELGDYGFMPTNPEELHGELASRGLTMLGAYHGVYLRDPAAHAPGREKALRIATLLAAVSHAVPADPGEQAWRPFLVLADEHSRDAPRFERAGRIGIDDGLSTGDWRQFTRGAQEIADVVQGETGIETVFHPHCAGYVETPDEIERFLHLTDPELMAIVLDTGHYLYGGGTSDGSLVLEGIDRFRERIRYVHFKDCDRRVATRAREAGLDYRGAVGEGVFCELGEGSVDFGAVLEKLRELDYVGWITVEQDVLPGMGSPKESAARNRDYLRTLGL
ncbi:MAG: sugar phosphate isomerase/epimerase [Trueperaceae bacterium]